MEVWIGLWERRGEWVQATGDCDIIAIFAWFEYMRRGADRAMAIRREEFQPGFKYAAD